MTKLSSDLLPIYELELSCGNEIERVDEPAGTDCPYAVVFKYPLHKMEIESTLYLVPSVRYWQSRDLHYDASAGYVSDTSKHAIAGPVNK